ncbi:hypothetical protein TMatcc_005910 [Talaromyces marneffei ATCC 18224]
MKPFDARPTGSSGPSGLELSTSRVDDKSTNFRGGFDHPIKRFTYPLSVQIALSDNRNFSSREQRFGSEFINKIDNIRLLYISHSKP